MLSDLKRQKTYSPKVTHYHIRETDPLIVTEQRKKTEQRGWIEKKTQPIVIDNKQY